MEHQIDFRNHLGETLAATLHQPEGDCRAAVVAGHCFTCSRHTGIIRQVCNDLGTAGFMVLRFDFSGNGQSQGAFAQSTWSKQVQEMAAAVAFMQARGADWIGLVGHSLGAAVALITARRTDDIDAVCRIAGRTSPARPMHFLSPSQQQMLADTGHVEFSSRGRQLTLNRDFFDDAMQYDLEAATRDLKIPMLVVHGEADEIIPASEARLAKAANPDGVELILVDDGDHMFSKPDHQTRVGQQVTDWFCRQAGLPLPGDDGVRHP